jgi:phosphoserine aminotransferase
VTLVILRKDLAGRAPDSVPEMFRYRTHIENQSLYNTPPTFAVYMLCLVTRWLKGRGGVAAMEAVNNRKADKLYAEIDRTGFYRGTALPEFRSTMNVTFRLPGEDLENAFIKEAKALDMDGLKGHRSVGGIRASIYNAFPEEGVDALVAFMRDFEARHG